MGTKFVLVVHHSPSSCGAILVAIIYHGCVPHHEMTRNSTIEGIFPPFGRLTGMGSISISFWATNH